MRTLTILASGLTLAVAAGSAAADEADAQEILKGMSDYLAALDAFSFDYDSEHEVVTTEGEKLSLARSGTVTVARPDRMHATRLGGFASLEMAFDGEMFALSESESGLHTTVPVAGDLDGLIDALRDTYGRPLPAADLIISDPHPMLMEEVSEIKDLGSGVIGGVECDHLAFRGAEVDWQIWIALGEKPYPCLFIITTRDVPQAPQYRVAIRDWRETTGETAFGLAPGTGATEVDIETFTAGAGDFPDHFTLEEDQ